MPLVRRTGTGSEIFFQVTGKRPETELIISVGCPLDYLSNFYRANRTHVQRKLVRRLCLISWLLRLSSHLKQGNRKGKLNMSKASSSPSGKVPKTGVKDPSGKASTASGASSDAEPMDIIGESLGRYPQGSTDFETKIRTIGASWKEAQRKADIHGGKLSDYIFSASHWSDEDCAEMFPEVGTANTFSKLRKTGRVRHAIRTHAEELLVDGKLEKANIGGKNWKDLPSVELSISALADLSASRVNNKEHGQDVAVFLLSGEAKNLEDVKAKFPELWPTQLRELDQEKVIIDFLKLMIDQAFQAQNGNAGFINGFDCAKVAITELALEYADSTTPLYREGTTPKGKRNGRCAFKGSRDNHQETFIFDYIEDAFKDTKSFVERAFKTLQIASEGLVETQIEAKQAEEEEKKAKANS